MNRPTVEQPLDIVDFVFRLGLLEEAALSPAQRACLKVIYGCSLDEPELEIFRRATGRQSYLELEQSEATLIVGRRGGKTSRIAAIIAVYEAFRNHKLPQGERAYVLLIAPVLKQAHIAFHYISNYIQRSPLLKQAVDKVSEDEIDLKNGITIACYPCSYSAVRGVSVICAICDEMAFWEHEETAANPEEEVIAALRPAMATFPNAKLIKISTPFGKQGILWRDSQQRAELGHLVWQLSSQEMNPAISPDVLERERQRNEENFRREYLAQFTDHITGWIGSETLDQCVVKGRTEWPRIDDAVYAAAVDPAFKGSDFALAIAHRSRDGTIVVDRLATWTGTKQEPLGYEWVCGQIARILGMYEISAVLGDQHCAAVIQQEFLKLGITFQESTFGSCTRMDIFGNLKHLLIQRRIELLDDPKLLRQLRNLEERKTASGNIDVRPAGSMKDDLSVAVALAASELTKRPSASDLFLMPSGKPYFNPHPESCQHQAVCTNFPYCVDEGICQDFVSNGLIG